jgi:type II secretory pathway component PulK
MRKQTKNNGSVFLIIVFTIALMATITMGILVMTTEELQLMQNQLYAAEAMTTAEAGLNDAFAQIRSSSSWTDGFTNKLFSVNGVNYTGTYTVTVTGTLPTRTITSTATSSRGFAARVQAGVTVGTGAPYVIRIDSMRINE